MPDSFIIFSGSLDDLHFARRQNTRVLIRYACDFLSLRTIVEKSGPQVIFAQLSVSKPNIKEFAENALCTYAEYNSDEQLSILLSQPCINKEIRQPHLSGDFSEYERISPAFARLAGNSPAMDKLRRDILLVARHDVSVLILGETGTGKSTVARAIQELGTRRQKPFKTAVISNTNDALIESKLFGVADGGFTGAVPGPGLFEESDGGTLFLDEIGEIHVETQTKLLQVLSEGIINRIGSNNDVRVDVRMIFATNADLYKKVAEKTFRPDLFYRIEDIVIEIPPLRTRTEDIPDICRKFILHEHLEKDISPAAVRALQTFNWHGNIRQLEKCLKRAALFYCPGTTIEPEHLHL